MYIFRIESNRIMQFLIYKNSKEFFYFKEKKGKATDGQASICVEIKPGNDENGTGIRGDRIRLYLQIFLISFGKKINLIMLI